MYDRTGNYLTVAILIGLILGVITATIFGENAVYVGFLGDIFLNALKMVVIPLLFCSIIMGIVNLGDATKLGRTGLKSVLYFLATGAIAALIGILLVNVITPGAGHGAASGMLRPAMETPAPYSFFTWLADQVPANIFRAAAETQILPLIVLAVFLGLVLVAIGNKGRPVIAVFDGINDAMMKIVRIVLWFAPVGIFGLVAGQIGAHGGMSGFVDVLGILGNYALVVIIGLILHAVIILPLILRFFSGKSPIEYFIGVSQALMTGLATASPAATLPVTMECVEEKNDVDKRASSLVLPLGAAIGVDGTALFQAVAAVFIAQAWGIDLSIFQQLTIFVTAVLASIGTAGVPQAALMTLALVLRAAGLPIEGIGMILAVDWFLDRCRATVNIWGSAVGAAVIAATAEIGLVERRKKKPFKPSRISRIRSFVHRKEERPVGKPSEPARAPSVEHGAAQSRRPEELSRGKFQRPSRYDRKREQPHDRDVRERPHDRDVRERPRDRDAREQPRDRDVRERPRDRDTREQPRDRDVREKRGDRQPTRISPPMTREEYKPTREAPAEKVEERVIKPPVSETKPETKETLTEEQKQVFGRKRHRPQYVRNRHKESDRKAEGVESGEAAAVGGVPSESEKPPFEIPKFPERILDKLTGSEPSTQDAEKVQASAFEPDSELDIDLDRPMSPTEERPSLEPTAFDEDLSQPEEAAPGSPEESSPIQRADWDIPESGGSDVSIDSEPDIPPAPETTEERGYSAEEEPEMASAVDEDRAEPEPDDRYRGESDSSDDSGRSQQENEDGQQRDDTLPAEERASEAETEADEESKPDDEDESVKWGRNRQR